MKLISQTIGESQCWTSGEDECFMPMIQNNIYVTSDNSVFCCLLRIILYCVDNIGCFLLIGKALYYEVNKIVANGLDNSSDWGLGDLAELEFPSELLSSIESLRSTEHLSAPGWLVFEALFQYIYRRMITERMVGGTMVGEFVDLYSISQDRVTIEYGNSWNDKERSTLFSALRKKGGIIGAMEKSQWYKMKKKICMASTFLFSL